MNILVGDIGGTKTDLALVAAEGNSFAVTTHARYMNETFNDFNTVLEQYLDEYAISADIAGFAVAGPVTGNQASLTNLPWHISASDIQNRFSFDSVTLLNDLEGLAWSLKVNSDDHYTVLQRGTEQTGNKAVIAAGTGLGEAIIHCSNGLCQPFATEGGHCDFAPRNRKDKTLHQYLAKSFGHVSWEHIVSGQGLINLYRFLLHEEKLPEPEWLDTDSTNDPAAVISGRALEQSDSNCVAALHLFVHYYGQEAGNLALKAKSTGGLYLGGGIAEKILPALQAPDFINAFNDKGTMKPLLQSIPVKIIADKYAALKGIAACTVNHAL